MAPVTNGCEQFRGIIEKYAWDANVMLAIMKAENRACDAAKNNLSADEDHGVCVGSYGLLQVGCLHFNSNQNPNDIETNIKVAYSVWTRQGYTAWTMYSNNEYRKYL